MTQFEIIILSIIYLFCYGFTFTVFIKEENVWLRTFFAIISFGICIVYTPLTIGKMLYKKLKEK